MENPLPLTRTWLEPLLGLIGVLVTATGAALGFLLGRKKRGKESTLLDVQIQTTAAESVSMMMERMMEASEALEAQVEKIRELNGDNERLKLFIQHQGLEFH